MAGTRHRDFASEIGISTSGGLGQHTHLPVGPISIGGFDDDADSGHGGEALVEASGANAA